MIVKNPFKQQVYEYPRMALKPICEYQTASPSRRNTIIKNSRVVPTYIAKRYNIASEAIASYLSGADDCLDDITARIHEIHTATYKTENEQTLAMQSAEALTAFLKDATSMKAIFAEFRLEATDQFVSHKLSIEGVEISIRPEIIIRSQKSDDIIGFIKFHFAKTEALTEHMADSITCLGRYYFNEIHSLRLAEKNCFVIDLFRGEVSSAPRSYKRRMTDITASCREIADRWHRFN